MIAALGLSAATYPRWGRVVNLAALMATCVLVVGCGVPVRYGSGPYQQWDKDTEYHVAERPGGFQLSVLFSRYQFFPSPATVESACRSTLTSMAYTLAEQRGRKIRPINEQRIQLSTGRNIASAITSCSATAPVEYE